MAYRDDLEWQKVTEELKSLRQRLKDSVEENEILSALREVKVVAAGKIAKNIEAAVMLALLALIAIRGLVSPLALLGGNWSRHDGCYVDQLTHECVDDAKDWYRRYERRRFDTDERITCFKTMDEAIASAQKLKCNVTFEK